MPVGPAGGAGQRAGVAELLAAEVVADLKGRDMKGERFAGMFGLAGDEGSAG